MELWIRTQTGYDLYKIDEINIDENFKTIRGNQHWLGSYKTMERCMQILDEIQNKLQNKFLCKPIALLKPEDVFKQELELNDKYKKDFIMQPSTMNIEPINCDSVIYEMPKE